jgi:hypothetical protein
MTGNRQEPPRRCRTDSATKSLGTQAKTSIDRHRRERYLGNPLFDAYTDRRSLRRSMYASSSEAATKVRRPILIVDSCSGFQQRTGESRRRASYSTTMSLPDTDTVPRPRGQTFVSILNVVPSPGIFAKICWGPRTICPFSTS